MSSECSPNPTKNHSPVDKSESNHLKKAGVVNSALSDTTHNPTNKEVKK